ncbi:MAG: response regulator transcription factor [Rhodothermia bacterium]
MWLLLIEDEQRLAQTLKSGLEEEGYIVDVAADGVEGETMALVNAYDAIIVDWRLPGRDGRTVIEHLRDADRVYPILMLTALGDVEHRVAGLDAGADDYLPKPFKFEELLARLRALLRRPVLMSEDPVLRLGPLEINTRRREADLAGARLDLRPKEYGLLEDLMRHPDEVLSRTVLAERVWGDAFNVSDNVIDVTVSNLRQKLGEAQKTLQTEAKIRVETVRGVGYRLLW